MKEGKVRIQKPMAETSYENGYLQGVKSALTHFEIVRNRKGTIKETPGTVWEQVCQIYIYYFKRIFSKEH